MQFGVCVGTCACTYKYVLAHESKGMCENVRHVHIICGREVTNETCLSWLDCTN